MSLLRALTDWCAERFPTVMLTAYYAGIVLVGLVGFDHPSFAVSEVLGIGSLVYSSGMLGCGLVALLAVRVAGRQGRRVEALMLVLIAVLTVLDGVMIFVAGGGTGGAQTGTRLMIVLPGAMAFAYYRAETVYTRGDIQRQLDAAKDVEAAAKDVEGPL